MECSDSHATSTMGPCRERLLCYRQLSVSFRLLILVVLGVCVVCVCWVCVWTCVCGRGTQVWKSCDLRKDNLVPWEVEAMNEVWLQLRCCGKSSHPQHDSDAQHTVLCLCNCRLRISFPGEQGGSL